MDPVTASLVLGGVQMGADLGGAFLGDYQNRKAAKKQYKYWKWSTFEGPGLRMAGLRQAGLNPILAAGSSAAQSMSPGMSARNVHMSKLSDSVSSASDAGIKKRQLGLVDAQIDTARAQQRMFENQAAKFHWEASSASVQAYKDKLLATAYEKPIVQKFAPFLRAYAESGLPASSAFQLLRLFK